MDSSTPSLPSEANSSPLYNTLDAAGEALQAQAKEQLFAVSIDKTRKNTKGEAIKRVWRCSKGRRYEKEAHLRNAETWMTKYN